MVFIDVSILYINHFDSEQIWRSKCVRCGKHSTVPVTMMNKLWTNRKWKSKQELYLPHNLIIFKINISNFVSRIFTFPDDTFYIASSSINMYYSVVRCRKPICDRFFNIMYNILNCPLTVDILGIVTLRTCSAELDFYPGHRSVFCSFSLFAELFAYGNGHKCTP